MSVDTGSLKFSAEIWRHFDVEDNEAICGLCRETLTSSLEHMKNHLEEKHSSVLDAITQKALDAASEDDNDDDMYTEVVYLEDEMNNTETPKKTKRPKSKVRKPSTSSDDIPFKHKNAKHSELNAFINYITSLLKKVPKEATQKLHLDIINMIMAASVPQHKIIIDICDPNASSIMENKNIVFSVNTEDQNVADYLGQSSIISHVGKSGGKSLSMPEIKLFPSK